MKLNDLLIFSHDILILNTIVFTYCSGYLHILKLKLGFGQQYDYWLVLNHYEHMGNIDKLGFLGYRGKRDNI